MPDSLAKYDPDTCLWKTSQACLFEEWIEFSETFPNSGMMRNGELYPQPMSEPPTSASGSGLWPTPQSRDYKGARLDGKTSAGSQTNLNDAVRQEWATPSAADAVGSTGPGTEPQNGCAQLPNADLSGLEGPRQGDATETGSCSWTLWIGGFSIRSNKTTREVRVVGP
jgi:hypothetical protein